MASEEASGKREQQIKLPDHIVNFVDFKREMVRLDYTAEQLRRACQEVEERRVKLREGLQQESDQVAVRAHSCMVSCRIRHMPQMSADFSSFLRSPTPTSGRRGNARTTKESQDRS